MKLARATPILRSFDEAKARDYRYVKPHVETAPWGERFFTVTGPFGNRLTFFEPDP